MTLKTKISLSVACAITLAIIFTLTLTWDRVSSFIISTEEAHFSSMAENIENYLDTTFHEYLTSKVRVVLSTKRHILTIVKDAYNDLRMLEQSLPPSLERSKLRQNLLENHNLEQANFHKMDSTSVLLTTTTDFVFDGFPALDIPPMARDINKRYVADSIAQLPAEGAFSLWTSAKNQDAIILLFMLPIYPGSVGTTSLLPHPDRMIVAGVSLDSLFKEAKSLMNARLEATKENFNRTALYEGGCILLRDAEGKKLIERGDSTPIEPYLQELYKKANTMQNVTEHISTPKDTFLCHVSWIQSYACYLVMSAPLSVLRAPSTYLVSKLLFIGIVILTLAVCLTIFTVMKALRPLTLLASFTTKMADLDPSSGSSLNAMEKMTTQLSLRRKDELGELARSFMTMSQKLVKNIRESMAAIAIKRRIEGELSAARDIQMNILPTLDAGFSEHGFEVAAFLEPAQEVGGDLYDCFPIDCGKKAIAIGDVSGKGVPAALFMTMTVTLIRYALRLNLSPADALTQINTLLEEHNSGNMFVTLFIGVYDPKTGDISYANGGHCLPFIVNKNGELRQLNNLSGPLVGAMPSINYADCSDRLEVGDRLLLYTDGLTEAMDSNKNLYGDERLGSCIQQHHKDAIQDFLDAIYADICNFRGEEPPSDDITMLTVIRTDPEKPMRS